MLAHRWRTVGAPLAHRWRTVGRANVSGGIFTPFFTGAAAPFGFRVTGRAAEPSTFGSFYSYYFFVFIHLASNRKSKNDGPLAVEMLSPGVPRRLFIAPPIRKTGAEQRPSIFLAAALLSTPIVSLGAFFAASERRGERGRVVAGRGNDSR
jgi:hypothetical protein